MWGGGEPLPTLPPPLGDLGAPRLQAAQETSWTAHVWLEEPAPTGPEWGLIARGGPPHVPSQVWGHGGGQMAPRARASPGSRDALTSKGAQSPGESLGAGHAPSARRGGPPTPGALSPVPHRPSECFLAAVVSSSAGHCPEGTGGQGLDGGCCGPPFPRSSQ